MQAIINKIIPFSNVDGPGNRMAIFLQGCPFRCWYCHNPETINICNNCGQCVSTCPSQALTIIDNQVEWDKNKCVNCDTCIKTCPNMSSPKVTSYSVDQLMQLILKNKPFISGVTFSGGECMNYVEFLIAITKQLKDHDISVLIDSNGYKDFSFYPELIENIDGVMLDVKAFDEQFHYQLTKMPNDTVIKNLKYLNDINKLHEVRTVLLPHFQAQNLNTIENVSKLINPNTRYKLIKYRQYGVRPIGIEVLGDKTLNENELNDCHQYLLKCGHKNIITV